MLNGDVLTDLDLTAQLAQHEATGAIGDARARPRGRPLRLRPRAPARGPERARVRREAAARRDRHEPDLAPAPTSSSARCSTSSRPEQKRLDRARGLAAARRRRPLRVPRRGLLARHRHARALPAGHLRHPRGQRRARRVRERLGTTSCRSTTAARSTAAWSRPRWWSAAAASTRSAHVGSPRRAGRGRVGRRRARRSSAASSSTGRRSAPAARCAAASSRPGRGSATTRRSTGGAVLGEGVTVGAGNVLTAGAAPVPGDGAARRGDQVLGERESMSSSGTHTTLDREAVAARRRVRPARRTSWRSPSTCATRCGRSSRPASTPWDSPGGLVVAGHGRLGDRRRAGPRRARRPRLAPAPRRPRLRAAAVDHARHDGAVRELLGRHRGDAGLPTRPPARSARAASS